MRLEVNGNQYTNFTRASCQLRLDSISSEFEFEAVAPKNSPLPFKGGEECKVLVDGEAVLTGNIEIIDVDYSGDDHTLLVRGRSKTADLLDSSIDELNDIFGDELTLKKLIEIVLAHIGSSIKVIDEVNPEPFNFAEDVPSPEPGDNAFEFVEKFARKRQVLLTDDADGNVVITSNSGIRAEGAIQHVIGAEDNNVINANFSYDTTGRYNAYKIAASLNPVALNQAGDSGLASLVNQSGGVLDSQIRSGRQLILISEVPFSSSECKNRVKWEADVRRARGLIYSATVPGYRVGIKSGALWQKNRIYRIVDDFVGKIEPMLVNSILFTFDAEEGRNTTLGFVGEKAYTLFLEPDPLTEEATNVS